MGKQPDACESNILSFVDGNLLGVVLSEMLEERNIIEIEKEKSQIGIDLKYLSTYIDG